MEITSKANILLVDDDPNNQLSIKAILEGLGQNIVTASSGEEALKHLLKDEFAVILLDVCLPGLDGFGTAALIRQREKSWYTPIIFITAVNNSETHVAKGYSLGAVDYIVKPLIPEILRSKVSVFVDLYQKTEAVKQQAEMLRHIEQQEYERKLYEQWQEMELEFLRRENEKEKRLVEKLARKSEELTRFNEELKQFANIIAHDLQEPLRMVTSYVQLMARRCSDKMDPEMTHFMDFVLEGSKRMQTMIQDLLSYAVVGAKVNRLEPTDYEKILSEVLANLAVAIAESQADITHDPLPVVVSDRIQIVQVLQNLLGNALKFHNSRPPRIHIGVKEEDEEWVFSVTDNGIGIEKEYAERIFQIFQRLHTREQYNGSGIGLAICKKIVENHGGRIWVESEPGMGSTFYFSCKKHL